MLCAAGTCGDGNGLTFASPGQTCQTLKTKYPTYNGTAQYYIQGINFVFPTPYLVRHRRLLNTFSFETLYSFFTLSLLARHIYLVSISFITFFWMVEWF
jgi:hypothetical protein